MHRGLIKQRVVSIIIREGNQEMCLIQKMSKQQNPLVSSRVSKKITLQSTKEKNESFWVSGNHFVETNNHPLFNPVAHLFFAGMQLANIVTI